MLLDSDEPVVSIIHLPSTEKAMFPTQNGQAFSTHVHNCELNITPSRLQFSNYSKTKMEVAIG